MVAYAVETEDLIGVRDQLAAQAALVGATGDGVAATTTTLLNQLEVGLTQTQTAIDGLLEELSSAVRAAGTAAEAADWLGPDSELFRQSNIDLVAAITGSQAQLETALTGHRTAITAIGQTLLGTLEEFRAEAGRSQELTAQLSGALGTEAESYEQAFNGGWNAVGAGTPAPGTPTAGTPTAATTTAATTAALMISGAGEDPTDPAVTTDPLAEHTLVDEKVEAETGVVEGSVGDEDGPHASGEVAAGRAEASVEAKTELSATEGAAVSASAGASAVVGAAEVEAEAGPVKAHGEGYALGAEASTKTEASVGPDGAHASVESEAFVGGKAGGGVSAEAGGVTAGVGGEVSYGIGAHAKVDGSFTTDEVGVSVDVGATLGVGAGVQFDVSIDPEEVLDDLDDLL